MKLRAIRKRKQAQVAAGIEQRRLYARIAALVATNRITRALLGVMERNTTAQLRVIEMALSGFNEEIARARNKTD